LAVENLKHPWSVLANGVANMMREAPGRYGLFAFLSMVDVEGSLKEIEYAFDVLKADGVGLSTSYVDKYPGDPKFAPIFEELNRRKAVVFIHPTAPNCCGSLNTGAPPSILELPFDEARAVASLVFNGTVTRYPDIKFIFSHAGGPVPVLATRMDQLMRNPKIAERVPEGVPATLKKLYFEVANSTVNPSSMAALLALSAPSQILFGSDYPYVQMEKTVGGLDRQNAVERAREQRRPVGHIRKSQFADRLFYFQFARAYRADNAFVRGIGKTSPHRGG
jgi:predicted TIM-barrel fold metal-dependent hydrolase